MNIVHVSKKDLDLKEYIKRSAKETDYDTLITEPTMLMVDGEIKVVYDHLNFDTSSIVDALRRVKYATGKRSRGLVSTSRILGYRPRNEMRQNYCSTTSLAGEAPKEHKIVADFALQLEQFYKKHNPDGYQRHKQTAEEKIRKDWRIEGESIFTSGIINKNNPLKYHFDTGNFTDVYSMMTVFKAGIEGGYLALPEYGIGFALPNNSVFMFDGQGILHGVTPIKYTSPAGYRYSVVYYTLKRMWQCLEINEEIARVRTEKTIKERVRMEVPLTEADRILKEEKRAMLKDRMGKQ